MSAGCAASSRSDGPIQVTRAHAGAPLNRPPPPLRPRAPILGSVLEAIGDTPLVRINRIAVEEGVSCEVLAKCEFLSAGGSVKDRIGYRMVEDAERSGRIQPGAVLIEPTSGNTGIGIALAGAIKGYRVIITLPEKMSQEKVDVLKALGAEIIRTPTEAAFDSPESHIGVAKRLQQEIPNAHILNQYGNPSNPLAHYDGTGLEIWEGCGGRVDVVVMTAGTGGTITGIARRLKEKNPACIIVGVDPKGSILAEPEAMNDEKRLQSYAVEGIGYDFIPTVLDRSLVDLWVKTEDRESFIMSRRLIREEGMLVGGSAGSAMAGAMKAAKILNLGKDKRMVVLLADGVRNYMSKFLSNDWMWRMGFADPELGIGVGDEHVGQWWSSRAVADLALASPITTTTDVSCAEAVQLLSSLGVDQIPIVDPHNEIVGVLTEGNLTSKLASGAVKGSDSVSKAIFSQFRRVTPTTKLSELARLFDRDAFAVAVQTQRCFGASKDGGKSMTEKSVVVGVVSRIDLLRFITQHAGDVAPGTPRHAGGKTPTAVKTPSHGEHPAGADVDSIKLLHLKD